MNYPQQPEVKHTYEIIATPTREKLAAIINEKLTDGYLLAGEFRVEHFDDEATFLQPMMKSVIVPPTVLTGNPELDTATDAEVVNGT